MANQLFNQLILIDKETREPFGKELIQMEGEKITGDSCNNTVFFVKQEELAAVTDI